MTTIADTIMGFLRGINQIPGIVLFIIILAFMLGYIVGRAFTAETYWGRIWRAVFGGVLTLGFAPAGDAVNLLAVIYLLGFLFGVRVYVHAFLIWVWDIVVWIFARIAEVVSGFLKLFYYMSRSIHDIVIGFSRMKMFSWEWDAKVKEANARGERAAESERRESASRSQSRPDVEAARRAREEDLRRQRRAEGQTKEQAYAREEPRQERRDPPPPPRTSSEDEKRRDAAMTLGIDPMLFTFEDLRQAYRKKVRQLHPDQYEQLPDDIRKQLDDKLKAVNVAHDLLKKWKGWK